MKGVYRRIWVKKVVREERKDFETESKTGVPKKGWWDTVRENRPARPFNYVYQTHKD